MRGVELAPALTTQHVPVPPQVSLTSVPDIEQLNRRMENIETMLSNLTRSPSHVGLNSEHTVHLTSINSSLLREISIKTRKDQIPGRQQQLRTRFLGASCTKVLLNLFPDAKEFIMSQNKTEEAKELFMALRQYHRMFSDDHRAQLVPIPVFVDSMTPIQRRMADILPKRSDCDRLLETYIRTGETIYRIIHVPTFRNDYFSFWNNEPRSDSFLPQLLVILALATKYEGRSRGPNQERLDGINIPTACTLVRMWLDGLKGKELVDMTTLQTEVLLSHMQRMVVKPQESWSRLGFIVRMAMSMGMHRDPSEFSGAMPAFQGELRRRLWWTIMDMDLQLSLQCNLPCALRDDDFTCRPPHNLNDEDLYSDMDTLPEEKPHDRYTACQLQVHAAKSLIDRLRVVNLVSRIDTADETEILEAGARLERILEDVQFNFPRPAVINDKTAAARWRTRVVLDMHSRRPLLALYRPFALAPPSLEPPPAQIVRSYLRSAMSLLNYLEELDPASPIFPETQHQYFLLMHQDIIQAVFSVCYFIRDEVLRQNQTSAVPVIAGFAESSSPLGRQSNLQSNGSCAPVANSWAGAWSATTPESSSAAEDGLSFVATLTNRRGSLAGRHVETESPCSLSRMEATVTRVLGALVSRMREVGSDLKDFLSISVVLSTARMAIASPEQKLEHIMRGMRNVLEVCKQVKSTMADQQPGSFLSPTSNSAPIQDHTPSSAGYAHNSMPISFHPNYPTMGHGVDTWDQEFWSWIMATSRDSITGIPMSQLPSQMAHVKMSGAHPL